ncbi:MAG: glycoside hydrolase family 127 protein [Clostridia bacterium]
MKDERVLVMNYAMRERDFWGIRMALACEKMIPLQLAILEDRAPDTEPSHAIENFRIAAGLSNDEFYGMVFQDSDVGKWIEAAAYSLRLKPDSALEAQIDEVIEIVAKAQQPDGYLNTYFTVKEAGKRWTNLQECHEMYCAGHLMEGAVAYADITGKRTLLDVMCRMADHMDKLFGPEEGKLRGYPGHPEVELGLYRLYGATQNPRFLKLAQFFLDERGKQPFYFVEEYNRRGQQEFFKGTRDFGMAYAQWHLPVREQQEAVGHAVRALYLYAAMANVACETKDQSLAQACDRLWNSCVNRKMSLTGGFGATQIGEAFLGDYELPNDSAYNETCASIAMLFFGRGMLRLHRDGRIADEMERVLYNGMLSGMQLDGTRFFYVNPLEVVQGTSGIQAGFQHDLPVRPKWFGCACCPPNLARLIASLPEYCYEVSERRISIHQYLGGTAQFDLCGGTTIQAATRYPWEGKIDFQVTSKGCFELAIRIPHWAKNVCITLDGEAVLVECTQGYAILSQDWSGSHAVVLSFDMPVHRVYSHPKVRQCAGMVAFMRGPLVYCFEGVENPEPLCALKIARDAQITELPYDENLLGGVVSFHVEGLRELTESDELYRECAPKTERVSLTAIPYYAWANREPKDMRVWMLEKI